MGYKYKSEEIRVNPDTIKMIDPDAISVPSGSVIGTDGNPIRARDNVSHYTTGKVETIDYITDKLGANGSLLFVLGNIIKYASRAMHKGQLRSDLEKIRNYATIALEILDEHETTTKE